MAKRPAKAEKKYEPLPLALLVIGIPSNCQERKRERERVKETSIEPERALIYVGSVRSKYIVRLNVPPTLRVILV